jgi:hypothetical protein
MIALVSGFAAVGGGKSAKSGNSTSTVQGISGFVRKYVPIQGLIAIGTFLFILIALFVILGRGRGDRRQSGSATSIEPFSMTQSKWLDWTRTRSCSPISSIAFGARRRGPAVPPAVGFRSTASH